MLPRLVPSKIAFFQNSGKHGKSGDAHCRPHKKSERQKRHLLNGKFWIEHFCQADAQGKWQHNADIADQNDCSPLFKNAFEINLKADHKHEEQKSKLTQNRNRRQGRRGKNKGRSTRKESSKKRRAEDNASCHFPDHTRLSNVLKNPAQYARAIRMAPIERMSCSVFTRLPF